MIFRIIHLSDLHSKSDYPKNFEIERISKAVSTLADADEYAIVVSGDVAFSGKNNEYNSIKAFFKNLCLPQFFKRKVKFINYIYVPGNHDIDYDYSEVPSDVNQFEKIFGKTVGLDHMDIEKVETVYSKAMKEFYKFSKKGHCEWEDPIINTKSIRFGDCRINFVMVNSAPFSLLKGQSIDKGNHNLTQKQLKEIRNLANAEINILVMHHSLEWFSDDTKRELREILANYYTAFLFGHEHDEIAERRTINYGGECLYVQGNAMADCSMRDNGFGVVDIDFNSQKVKAYSFVFEHDIYTHRCVADTNIHKKSNSGIVPLEEYERELEYDSYGEPFDNYYCFPGLEYTTFDEQHNPVRHSIKTETELLDFISARKKTTITGDRKTGKSLLAKRLYSEFLKRGEIVLLFDPGINSFRKERIVEYTFRNQYSGDDNGYERFLQLSNDKRVAIIDDADSIKPKSLQSLVDYLYEKFDTIVILAKEEISIDIKRQVQELIDDEITLAISQFWFSTRKELVKKILKALNSEDDQIEIQANQINELINIQVKYFNLTPEFIIGFVKQYIRDSRFQLSSGKEAFSIVYENSLKDRIIQNAHNITPENVLHLLQEIAYYMHFSRKKEIDYSELINCIDNYTTEYRQTISLQTFIDACKSAKILKEDNNRFSFKDSTHVAYFVARAINQKARLRSEDPEFVDARARFEEVLNALCFGINSDIVLFLSLITNDMNFVYIICEKAREHFNGMEELDFCKNNIPFISNVDLELERKTPGYEEKKHREESLAEVERKVKESEEIEVINEYDYTDDDLMSFANQSMISLKYLEILSKALPAFCAGMKRTQQDELVELIYRTPNQFLFMMLKDINDNIDEFVDAICDDAVKKGKQIERNDIKKITENIAAMFVASLYFLVSSTCTSTESIQALNDYKNMSDNPNYQLLNLMINSKIGDVNSFAKKAITADKRHTLPVEKTIINITVWDYFLRTNVELHGDGEALADYFFGKGKRKLELEQYKHQSKKVKK